MHSRPLPFILDLICQPLGEKKGREKSRKRRKDKKRRRKKAAADSSPHPTPIRRKIQIP